jgi:hypothetical protein
MIDRHIVGRLGEPLRTNLSPQEMRLLLSKYRFTAVRDEDLHTIRTALAAECGETRVNGHLLVVTADRRA